jgi:methyltransferase
MWLYGVIALVALQRLAELAVSKRNTKRLLADGGHEAGRAHYPWLIGLHVLWLVALVATVDPATRPNFWLLGFFVLLQLARAWVLVSLGSRWTTRIVVLPDAPLVTRGPYRYVRHPNYAVVAGEIAVLPLAFGAWQVAVVFSVLNGLLLAHRIRVEDRALGRA